MGKLLGEIKAEAEFYVWVGQNRTKVRSRGGPQEGCEFSETRILEPEVKTSL